MFAIVISFALIVTNTKIAIIITPHIREARSFYHLAPYQATLESQQRSTELVFVVRFFSYHFFDDKVLIFSIFLPHNFAPSSVECESNRTAQPNPQSS